MWQILGTVYLWSKQIKKIKNNSLKRIFIGILNQCKQEHGTSHFTYQRIVRNVTCL